MGPPNFLVLIGSLFGFLIYAFFIPTSTSSPALSLFSFWETWGRVCEFHSPLSSGTRLRGASWWLPSALFSAQGSAGSFNTFLREWRDFYLLTTPSPLLLRETEGWMLTKKLYKDLMHLVIGPPCRNFENLECEIGGRQQIRHSKWDSLEQRVNLLSILCVLSAFAKESSRWYSHQIMHGVSVSARF